MLDDAQRQNKPQLNLTFKTTVLWIPHQLLINFGAFGKDK